MNIEHQRALQSCLSLICRDVDTAAVTPFLASVLTIGQREELQTINRQDARNEKLVNMICGAGPLAFDLLLESFMKTGKEHVVKEINSHLLAYCRDEWDLEIKTGRTKESNERMNKLIGQPMDACSAELKQIYLKHLRKCNPFSLPFTFDIEKTWISLGLRQDADIGSYIRVDDHCRLIEEVFATDPRLLLIEGRAASGKTTLMRRIAYDWAKGDLDQYNLVFLIEIRHLPDRNYKTIAELALGSSEIWADLIQNLFKEVFSITNAHQQNRFLILLDGYDERKRRNICTELTNYLRSASPLSFLSFPHDIIITTRPGPLTEYNKKISRLKFAEVLGFDEESQRHAYIGAHFSCYSLRDKNYAEFTTVRQLLLVNKELDELAKTPLFLTFICLVHEHLKDGTIFELYRCIIWWLIDRYQNDHPDLDVPYLFGWIKSEEELKDEISNSRVIQDHFLDFPLLQAIGRLALENIAETTFSSTLIKKYDKNGQTVNRKALLMQKYFLSPIFGVIGRSGLMTPPGSNMPADVVETNFRSVDAINCGILLREEYRDGLKMLTRYLFPHRTIQEFLAGGCFYFWSDSFENQTAIDTFLSKKKKYQEVENFIFRSISSENVPNYARRYIEMQTELYIDLSQWKKDPYFTETLNKALQLSKNIRELTVSNAFGAADIARMAKPLDLKNLSHTVEYFKLDKVKFDFEEPIQQSVFHLNEMKTLKNVELFNIFFPSSETLACTMNTLMHNLYCQATIKFGDVKVKMNPEERVSVLMIDSESHLIRSFITEAEASRSSFPSELKFVFNYLACVSKVVICGDRKDFPAFDLGKSSFPINYFTYLKQIEFHNLTIEVKRMAIENLEQSEHEKIATIEEVYFLWCNFRAEKDIAKLMNYLTKQIRYSVIKPVVVQLYHCRGSFSHRVFSTKELQLSKYAEDWTTCINEKLHYE